MKFAKTYEPNLYEPTTYALWEQTGTFQPKNNDSDKYSIVMPPPNANGNLHIGHGLTIALEDILTRYYRLKGHDTIYIPGADHAGFETWVVYERALENAGKSRFDFTRDQLYEQVWNFVSEQRGNMELQLRAMGASCDWKNLVFTLDESVINTVYKVFEKMWDDGLVYRGKKIVNYCTTHQTGFADIEVVHKDEEGTLWDIAYPYSDGSGEIVISTTRPETMLGDTAVAVDPDDERYKDIIGKILKLPLTDREIPVIADNYVDEAFGTGAVKITPAHDPNDFEVGERHNLEQISVIDFNGKMNENAGKYANLTVLEARLAVLEDLKKAGLVKGESSISHSVGHCYKCGTVIEPLLKEQWFINVKPLVEKAIQAIENDEIMFTPESSKKLLLQYYSKLRDWNISRQIPWGIPIPAFVNENDPNDWIYDERVENPTIVVNDTTYIRDEDTFDTWFSSGQWPYITTQVLDNGELNKFYPLDVMETGRDLLYPWISRMIMLGLYATERVPFKHVYMHGMVLDEHGQKMSKSKGNVINPMDIISQCGSDAFRLGIVASRSAGQSQAFSSSKVIAGRNLCNKLWNIARFIQDTVGDDFKPTGDITNDNMGEDWIIRQLMDAKSKLDNLMSDYRFAEASELVYQVIWNDVADWFIESSKIHKNHKLLARVLEICLKLIHPFAPFVSETIWQNLSWTDSVLAAETWPEDMQYDEITAENFERLKKLVTEIRYLTNEIPGNERFTLLYQNDVLIEENKDLIKFLAKLPDANAVEEPRGLRLTLSGREAWLDVDGKTIGKYAELLQERLEETGKEISRLESRLSNENYINKAPENLVKETRLELEYKTKVLTRIKSELDSLKQE